MSPANLMNDEFITVPLDQLLQVVEFLESKGYTELLLQDPVSLQRITISVGELRAIYTLYAARTPRYHL